MEEEWGLGMARRQLVGAKKNGETVVEEDGVILGNRLTQ